MGSTGTGRFSDYPGSRGSGSGGGSSQGGEGQNQCEKAAGNILLEEVAICDYFSAHKTVPPVGDTVRLREQLFDGRLAIETESSEVIGFLPTRYNYLRQCIEQGYEYAGTIISSTTTNLPSVKIDLAPRL